MNGSMGRSGPLDPDFLLDGGSQWEDT